MDQKTGTISPKPPKWMPVSAWLVIVLLYAIRFGYDYGASDQDEMLPYVLALKDPSLYPHDWFVQQLVSHANVRTFFAWALYAVHAVFPLAWAVFLGYLACWWTILQYMYRIAAAVSRNEWAGWLATLLGVVVFHKITIGSNDAVYNLLAPELVGWAFALPALYAGWQNRWTFSGLLLGIASCFHFITGFTTALVLLAVLFTTQGQQKNRRKFWLNYGLSALPILLVIGLGQIHQTSAPSTPSSTEIQFWIRLPLHHFAAYYADRFWGFWLMILAGGWGFWDLKRRKHLRHEAFLRSFWMVSGLLMLLGWIGLEVFHWGFIGKFQFYKLAVWWKMFALALFSGAIMTRIPLRHRQAAAPMIRRTLPALGLLLSLYVSASLMTQSGRPYQKMPLFYTDSSLAEMESWIQRNTPKSALFAVPPSNTTFRSHARRSIVINWLGFPFEDHAMYVWWTKLRDLTGVSHFQHRTALTALDEGFNRNILRGIRSAWVPPNGLTRQYCLIEKKRLHQPLPSPMVHQNRDWALYACKTGPL